MRLFHRFALLSALFSASCSSSGTGGTPGGDAATNETAVSGTCPLKLTVDGASYDAVSCNARGFDTVAAGLYQIELNAIFNRDPGKVRSIFFVIRDDDKTGVTHDHAYDATKINPGVDATYHATSLDGGWGTSEAAMKVGTGTLTLTKYDRTARLMSGTFSMVLKQGTDAKTVEGSFTDVPLTSAD